MDLYEQRTRFGNSHVEQEAILLPVRLEVPEKKVLTEVMLLLYHSDSGTVKSLIAVQRISLLR